MISIFQISKVTFGSIFQIRALRSEYSKLISQPNSNLVERVLHTICYPVGSIPAAWQHEDDIDTGKTQPVDIDLDCWLLHQTLSLNSMLVACQCWGMLWGRLAVPPKMWTIAYEDKDYEEQRIHYNRILLSVFRI